MSPTPVGGSRNQGVAVFRRAREGRPTLRANLTERAKVALRTKRTQFPAFHRALAGKVGYKRAVLATAHKLLRGDGPYCEPGVEHD